MARYMMAPMGPPGDIVAAHRSGAALFTLLWNTLADMLGAPATAALLCRAARRATPRCPELAELVVAPENFVYRLTVPIAWRAPGTPPALIELAQELRHLLAELTGQVVIRRLDKIKELTGGGDLPPGEHS